MKLFLDFFIPARELDFAVFNGVLFVMAIGLRVSPRISWRGFAVIAGVAIFFLAQLIRTPTDTIGYKLLTMPLLAVLFYNLGRSMDRDTLSRGYSVILVVFVFCFGGNYLLSAALGHLASREFWNFEHANLLGSYVLVMLIPVNFLATESRLRGMNVIKVAFVVMAFLTTSTGALILTLAALMRERKRSASTVLLTLASGCLVAVCALFFLNEFDKSVYDKIVAPYLLITGGGLDQLIQSARGASGITHFASDQQGSFTWRIYADMVYALFLANEGVTNLLAGNGIGGFSQVWSGAMPHNDFVLILVDFGAPFLLFVLVYVTRLFRYVARYAIQWRIVLIVITVRLTFENNIYSYYVLSSGLIFASLTIGALSERVVKKRSVANVNSKATGLREA
ncbi:hypothetical protein [Caballeronia zhejiangensis]|uniref:hypothetical protein n=1 Tax=Caballeronia zhejiangensis TaxID=871203 RepID=UPI001F528387|nr:hypothetical protein [Caballeronia zhejiangensis]MCI1047008.1 hypothetical protein [Caballeronia zhejiangensis]